MIHWEKANWNGERTIGGANWKGGNRRREGTGDQVRRKVQRVEKAKRGRGEEDAIGRDIGRSRNAPRGRTSKGAAEMGGRESNESRRDGGR